MARRAGIWIKQKKKYWQIQKRSQGLDKLQVEKLKIHASSCKWESISFRHLQPSEKKKPQQPPLSLCATLLTVQRYFHMFSSCDCRYVKVLENYCTRTQNSVWLMSSTSRGTMPVFMTKSMRSLLLLVR